MMHPPKIVVNGQPLAVIVLADIDGTVNDESLPEQQRLSSIGPAKAGLAQLEARGIPVGLITGRSYGEAAVYQQALAIHGFTICEDGASVLLPTSVSLQHIRTIQDADKTLALLSSVDTAAIQKFLEFILNEAAQRGSHQPILSTCTSTAEELFYDIPYETIADAERSMDRVGSAYVRHTSAIQRAVIRECASSWGIRIFGDPKHFHLLGADADKGRAMQFLNDTINSFLPGGNYAGILPIVFGNNTNDLPLFEKAQALHGLSILVKDTSGGYAIPKTMIKPISIKTGQPFGYGIGEAVPVILEKLHSI